MKLSKNYRDFKNKLDQIHPRYDDTMLMDEQRETLAALQDSGGRPGK